MNRKHGRRRDAGLRPRTSRRRDRLQVESLEGRQLLAQFIVNSIADSGAGTLRQAILDARGNADADTIVFSASLAGQTINLTTSDSIRGFGPTGLVVAADDVTIDGAGAPGLSISGNDERRIFAVGSSGSLTLSNLTLTGGRAQGGRGGDSVALNAAGGGGAGLGGAIYVYRGTLNIQNSTLTGNSAAGGRGGNISLDGSAPATAAATGGGSAGGDGGDYTGTGVLFTGGAGIGGSAPDSDDADGGDGGPNEFGVSVSASGGGTPGVSGGLAAPATGLSDGGFGGGGGGGNDNFNGGQAGGDGGFGAGGGGGTYGTGGGNGGFGGGGGGAYQRFADPATGLGGYGGGNGDASTNATGPGGGGAGLGGAIFNNEGTIILTNSTLVSNTTIGGAGGVGWGSGGQAGLGIGGAIFNRNGSLTIFNSTITANTSTVATGVVSLADGIAAANTSINNTIIGGSSFSFPDFLGISLLGGTSNTSGTGNLIRTAVGFNGTIASTADPLLGALASNGGPTQTLLPQAGSPVLGAGDLAAAADLTTDQRGLPRISPTNTVDIGSVQVAPPTVAPTITSEAAATFTVAYAQTFTITTTGTPTPTLTVAGTLPAGVTFLDNGDGTGTLAGTPAASTAGPYSFTITAANGTLPDAVQSFTLTVNPAIVVGPGTLPVGTMDNAYNRQLIASGGSGSAYAFAVTAGALPPGLTLDADGLISGTPTDSTGSPYTFTVTVTDEIGAAGTQVFTLAVNLAVEIATTPGPDPTVGLPYSQQFVASGGSGMGYVFAATGLPEGMILSPDGLLSGTPTGTAPIEIVVTVTDSQGGTATQGFVIPVNPALAITPTALPPAQAGVAYSQQFTPSGGSGEGYYFAAIGLPEGLTLSPEGLLSGTPTSTAVPAEGVTIAVADSNGAFQSFTVPLVVSPAAVATLAVTTSPASPVKGGPLTITVTALDAFGNVVAGYEGSVRIAGTPAQPGLPADVALVDGVGTFTTTLGTAGPQTFTVTGVTDPALSGTISVVVAASGPATRFRVDVAPGVAGGTTTFTVTALDAFGNVATGYAGTVSFSDSDPTAIVPGPAPLVDGVGTFTVVLGTSGSQAITVADPANPGISGTSGSVAVTGMARGTVFLDINADGIQDPGEPGLPGRAVFLDLNGNSTPDAGEPTAVTAADGSFSFPGIAQGTAPVVEDTDLDSSLRFVVDQARTLLDGSVTVGVTPYSPIAVVPVVPNPFAGTAAPDANVAYVRSLYLAILGREAGPGEAKPWADALANGSMSRNAVSSAIVNSPEHRTIQVTEYYRAYLGRGLDPFAQGWIDALLSGQSEESVTQGILNSPEYQSRHAADDAFISSLYQDVLGRDVDPAGLADTKAALANRTPRSAVIANVVNSVEAIDQILDGFYSSYFRRERDPASAYWEDMLEAPGGSATPVAAGLLSSDEFYGLARRGGQ
ncbi:putative Ig domain-containing protein [Tundrisphaera sp. TA3]|uniref:putative Ig domain-containing protein n=1 Tax=Tundrisphaera sp. TA3 TaxID=3435775 RepID=UPI003EB75225